jgi:hypothetical protein
MMAVPLPNGLQQNGPFIVSSGSMVPNISIPSVPRPSNTTTSGISSQDKKKDSPSETQEKKEDKRSAPTTYSAYGQDPSSIQSQFPQQAFAMINPSMMQGYEQMGFSNPSLNPTTMQGMHAIQAIPGMQGLQGIQGMQSPSSFGEMKVVNPYGFTAQNAAALQGNNAALLQQMMSMGMMPSGYGPQPPYTFIGIPPKSDSQENKSK